MKKIILLIIILFGLTGCYDYLELNDLAIVSGIIIDYQNDLYDVTFEILSDQKKGKDESTTNAYTLSAKGTSLAEAFSNIAKQTSKMPYYFHLKTLVLSKSASSKKIKEVIDFLLRSPKIKNEFYVVISKDDNAKEIFTNTNKEIPVVSDYIANMLEINQKTKNISTNFSFEEIIENFINQKRDAAITAIKLSDKNISIEGLAVFNDYKLKNFLTPEESYAYNILTKNVKNAIYNFTCKDKGKITLSIYESSPSLKINDKNELDISLELGASILEYDCKENLGNPETYKKFNETYAKEINKSIENFYELIQKNQTDILGIDNLYYIKNRKKKNWYDLNYNIKTKLKINTIGLLFEVNK